MMTVNSMEESRKIALQERRERLKKYARRQITYSFNYVYVFTLGLEVNTEIDVDTLDIAGELHSLYMSGKLTIEGKNLHQISDELFDAVSQIWSFGNIEITISTSNNKKYLVKYNTHRPQLLSI
jgi:hypothetical protein